MLLSDTDRSRGHELVLRIKTGGKVYAIVYAAGKRQPIILYQIESMGKAQMVVDYGIYFYTFGEAFDFLAKEGADLRYKVAKVKIGEGGDQADK